MTLAVVEALNPINPNLIKKFRVLKFLSSFERLTLHTNIKRSPNEYPINLCVSYTVLFMVKGGWRGGDIVGVEGKLNSEINRVQVF